MHRAACGGESRAEFCVRIRRQKGHHAANCKGQPHRVACRLRDHAEDRENSSTNHAADADRHSSQHTDFARAGFSGRWEACTARSHSYWRGWRWRCLAAARQRQVGFNAVNLNHIAALSKSTSPGPATASKWARVGSLDLTRAAFSGTSRISSRTQGHAIGCFVLKPRARLWVARIKPA